MKRILVVEDDDGTRDALVELLGNAGFATATATTGYEALVKLRAMHPDLMLLDLLMPHMNGWELLAALSDDAELARIPRVVMTAWPRPLDIPGVTVVKKPFEWN